MKPVICIAGPTASGKSAFALEIAKAVNGEIINADALQVYADLQILSARPTQDEMEGVPHHLFGHISGDVRYSVGEWLRAVEPVIMDCLSRDVVPILVGGTGLYFKALLIGLADIPAVSNDVRLQNQAYLAQNGIAALRARAEKLDAVATARVLGDDPQRLLRIVNVAEGTGQPLSVWQAGTHPIVPLQYSRLCALIPERNSLYACIERRYDQMLESGALDEAMQVFAKNYDESLPVMKAIGLRQLKGYLTQDHSFEKAVQDAKRESRRFAKRQLTWFRNQPPKGLFVRRDNEKMAFLNSMKELSL